MTSWEPGLPERRKPLATKVREVGSLGFIQVKVAVWWLPPNCLSLSSQVEMAAARGLGEVAVLGSLLLQHLLHFSRPCLILQSLSALTGLQLLTLAQSPAGSHVLDAVLTSPSVTRKQRRRVLKTLKVRFLAPV